MGRKGILLTITALILAVGAGIAGIAFVRSKYDDVSILSESADIIVAVPPGATTGPIKPLGGANTATNFFVPG